MSRFFIVSIIVFTGIAHAGTSDTIEINNLSAAIKLALQNNTDIINGNLDIESKHKYKNEVLSDGLPQIKAGGKIIDNLIIPTTVYPLAALGGPPGVMKALQIGTNYNVDGTVQARQMLFDQSFFMRLKAAGLSEQLYGRILQKIKETVAMQLASGYYSILLNTRQMEFLKKQLESYLSLYRVAEIQYKAGVKKKSDIDRIQVSQTNVETELEKFQNLYDQQISDLKLLIGITPGKQIIIRDSITDKLPFSEDAMNDVRNHSDWQVLQKQEELKELEIKQKKAGYLPILAVNAQFSKDFYGNDFNLNPWYNSSFVGLTLDFPLFDGLKRHAQIAQSCIDLKEIQNRQLLLKSTITKDIEDASNRLAFSASRLNSQNKNQELAAEVYRETSTEYKGGTASLSDLLNAENALLESQRQYLSALADKLVAEILLEKAKGTLLQRFNIN